MPTSRFLRSPTRTRTVTGTTSVGGSSSTVVSIYPDHTIRFTDRNGVLNVIPVPANYVTGHKDRIQPSSGTARHTSPADALYALVDALIARA